MRAVFSLGEPAANRPQFGRVAATNSRAAGSPPSCTASPTPFLAGPDPGAGSLRAPDFSLAQMGPSAPWPTPMAPQRTADRSTSPTPGVGPGLCAPLLEAHRPTPPAALGPEFSSPPAATTGSPACSDRPKRPRLRGAYGGAPSQALLSTHLAPSNLDSTPSAIPLPAFPLDPAAAARAAPQGRGSPVPRRRRPPSRRGHLILAVPRDPNAALAVAPPAFLLPADCHQGAAVSTACCWPASPQFSAQSARPGSRLRPVLCPLGASQFSERVASHRG